MKSVNSQLFEIDSELLAPLPFPLRHTCPIWVLLWRVCYSRGKQYISGFRGLLLGQHGRPCNCRAHNSQRGLTIPSALLRKEVPHRKRLTPSKIHFWGGLGGSLCQKQSQQEYITSPIHVFSETKEHLLTQSMCVPSLMAAQRRADCVVHPANEPLKTHPCPLASCALYPGPASTWSKRFSSFFCSKMFSAFLQGPKREEMRGRGK